MDGLQVRNEFLKAPGDGRRSLHNRTASEGVVREHRRHSPRGLPGQIALYRRPGRIVQRALIHQEAFHGLAVQLAVVVRVDRALGVLQVFVDYLGGAGSHQPCH